MQCWDSNSQHLKHESTTTKPISPTPPAIDIWVKKKKQDVLEFLIFLKT